MILFKKLNTLESQMNTRLANSGNSGHIGQANTNSNNLVTHLKLIDLKNVG